MTMSGANHVGLLITSYFDCLIVELRLLFAGKASTAPWNDKTSLGIVNMHCWGCVGESSLPSVGWGWRSRASSSKFIMCCSRSEGRTMIVWEWRLSSTTMDEAGNLLLYLERKFSHQSRSRRRSRKSHDSIKPREYLGEFSNEKRESLRKKLAISSKWTLHLDGRIH